ncbi:MAG: type II toxin-antitoxin system VapC family toxin [Acidobacteriaceae bacterium]|nr:type II toxin-antitoxin system VapC family toxin [Acidobacteriaceae bacterium]MBV8573128.1 type II toxin-antitoxin system VapC family toxin [Acidobacteriaceae bacterium]
MSEYVLDASVAAKWFLPPEREPFSEKARALFKAQTEGQMAFLVPDLFWAEMGNVLWKASRTQRMSLSDAEWSARYLRQLDFPTLRSVDFLEGAFQIATRFERSFYDSIYLALAKEANRPLLTADERLANAVAAYLPVRWLGAL